MSDKPSSKGPFNFRAKPDETSKEADEELSKSKTDKDNAAKRHDPPDHEQRPARNLAPFGMGGNRGSAANNSASKEYKVFEFTLEDDDEPSTEEDIKSKIDLSIDDTLTTGAIDREYSFIIKPVYIDNECRMERLTLMKDGDPVVHYDENWVLPVETEKQQKIVEKLQNQFGKTYSKEFKSYSNINRISDDDIDF